MTTETTQTQQQPNGADAAAKPDAAAPEAKKEEAQFLFEKPAGAEDKAKPTDKPPEGKADEKPGEKKPEDKADTPAPFKIEDMKVPDGFEMPETMKPVISGLAASIEEAKTPQERMQKIADAHVAVQNMQMESWNKMKSDWRQEIVKDPVLGGNNIDKTRAACDDVVRRFVPADKMEEFTNDLILLGLGNKKSFVNFLMSVHEKTREDNAAGAGGAGPAERQSAEKTLWPNMK